MNKKLMLIALISIIISFISCGEADLNPCYSIKCLDNQYCLDGSCIDVQPESLEFIKPPIPLKIFITSIVFTLGIWHGLKAKSGFYLSVIPFNLIVIISAFLIKISDGEMMFLLVSFFIIASVTLVIKNLINIQKKWTNER